MIDVDVIKLENGKDYIIVAKKQCNGIEYLYLSVKDDEEDMCIRKLIGDNIVPLDNENELIEAVKLFN